MPSVLEITCNALANQAIIGLELYVPLLSMIIQHRVPQTRFTLAIQQLAYIAMELLAHVGISSFSFCISFLFLEKVYKV